MKYRPDMEDVWLKAARRDLGRDPTAADLRPITMADLLRWQAEARAKRAKRQARKANNPNARDPMGNRMGNGVED